MTPLRTLWDARTTTYGAWCGLSSPYVVEILDEVGFDWICLDTQHGLLGRATLDSMLAVLVASGRPSFVRVGWNRASEIMQALDAGAQGVIVPLVNSAAEAAAAVDACRYPPVGHRSWGPTRAALRDAAFASSTASTDVVCIVMIETAAGLAAVDEIARVPGVDGIFVGPADLALTHGLSPNADEWDDRHERMLLRVLDACTTAGITPGIACPDVLLADRWRAMGYRMLAVASDGGFLTSAARAALAHLNATATQ